VPGVARRGLLVGIQLGLHLGEGLLGDDLRHRDFDPCRCHADPPRLHGPYAEWTRKIGGKTVTRRLTPAELTEYQPLFDNARKLRALLAELQDLTLQIIEPGSSQQPQASRTGATCSGKRG
jgi:hypothetical protein